MPEEIQRYIAKVQSEFARKLDDLSTADTARYLALFKARSAARKLGGDAWDAFERRYAATVAAGGALADVLDTEAALHEAREWAQQERAA